MVFLHIFGIAFLIFEKHLPRLHLNSLWILILMAVLLSAGNVVFYLAFKNNAPISIAVPVSTIGIALLGIVWGIVIAKEPFTLKLIIGFILSSVGIFLMAFKG